MGGCVINEQNRTCTQNWTKNISVTSKPISKVFRMTYVQSWVAKISICNFFKDVAIAYNTLKFYTTQLFLECIITDSVLSQR